MYPKTVDPNKNGKHVLAFVPSNSGYLRAAANDATEITLQAATSSVEKAEGFAIGSAGTISVFTIFLTAIAVYPATASEASHPPTVSCMQQS